MNRLQTRRHFDTLAATRRPNRGLSCGFPERYDPAGPGRDEKLLDQLGAVIDWALTTLEGPRSAVLDAGCGTFFYRRLLAERFFRVVGADSASQMLRRGGPAEASGGSIGLLVAEAERLPFAAGSFDCVVAIDVLHHLERPSRFAAEAARVLRPQGLYLGVEPNMLNPGMLVAHLLPPEERGALRWAWPFAVDRILAPCFARRRTGYFNLSFSSGIAGIARRLQPFCAAGGSPLGLRMAVAAARRP